MKYSDILHDKHYWYLSAYYLLALFVVFVHPVDIQQWQWADDALYKNNARAMFKSLQELVLHQNATQWLGDFSPVTLSKAPFFSVFIALSHMVKIPFKLSEFLLFSPLPFLFWIAVRQLKLPKWPILFLATTCLFFIPVSGIEVRLVRTVVFGALSMYCLIALCGLLIRCWIGEGRAWLWSLTAGLAMGLAATTREEAIWLIIPAIITVLITVYVNWKNKKISALLFIIPFIVAGYFVPSTIFSTLNYQSYGVYAPSLRQHEDFKSLYSTLASLEPGNRQKYVPIGTSTRLKAYEISPLFSELKPFLEGSALDSIATNPAHLSINGWGDKINAREFFVSNFEFALSKAIVLSGRATGKDFITFCRNTVSELTDAVADGKIAQGRMGVALLPPIYSNDYMDVLLSAYKSIDHLFFATESIKRSYALKPNPVPSVELSWHKYLGTWSAIPAGAIQKSSDYIFNQILMPSLKYCYYLVLFLSIISLIHLYRVEEKNISLYFFMAIISLSALASFNLAMGIVHTIGWPLLKWPQSYNAMGYYPLHFIMLISSTVLLKGITYNVINEKMNRNID